MKASFNHRIVMRWRHCWQAGLLLLALGALGACAAGGDVTRPIPTQLIHAPQTAHRVVVMLPGRGDDLAGLQRQHVAQLIQQAWPDADVILTGLTMPWYRAGLAPVRLHDEVIAPLQARGQRQVWLAGISLGGLGSLLYDQAYPRQVDGMLLLSPYLGEAAIQREIRAAGGLSAWQAGPAQAIGPDTFQRELWRYLKHWSDDPARARTVWLAYGASERFRDAIELMSPELPAGHVFMLPGHHDWTLWQRALPKLLHAADSAPRGDAATVHTGADLQSHTLKRTSIIDGRAPPGT
ncbi:MAG: alpha/beta hydrolase-fold protein [Rhodanobacter sp.]